MKPKKMMWPAGLIRRLGLILFTAPAVLMAGCRTQDLAVTALPPATGAPYDCVQVADDAIRIDADLSDPAWRWAPPLEGFRDTLTGEPVLLATQVKLLWSDRRLFVAFDCRSEGGFSELVGRDARMWDAETAEVFLNPHGAEGVYYEFDINPYNAIYDARLRNWRWAIRSHHWRQWADEFNPPISSAARIHRDAHGQVTGWSAELAIRWVDLDTLENHRPQPGDQWLFNVFRVATKPAGTLEYGAWQPTRGDFHRPRTFPTLRFVTPGPSSPSG